MVLLVWGGLQEGRRKKAGSVALQEGGLLFSPIHIIVRVIYFVEEEGEGKARGALSSQKGCKNKLTLTSIASPPLTTISKSVCSTPDKMNFHKINHPHNNMNLEVPSKAASVMRGWRSMEIPISSERFIFFAAYYCGG